MGRLLHNLWRTRRKQIQQVIDHAEAQDIKVILSNLCFEVWFVLRSKDSGSPYDSVLESSTDGVGCS